MRVSKSYTKLSLLFLPLFQVIELTYLGVSSDDNNITLIIIITIIFHRPVIPY